MGTERCVNIVAVRDVLRARRRYPSTPVADIITENGTVVGVRRGRRDADAGVVVKPGREGELRGRARWVSRWSRNPVDLSVRVELPAAVLQPDH